MRFLCLIVLSLSLFSALAQARQSDQCLLSAPELETCVLLSENGEFTVLYRGEVLSIVLTQVIREGQIYLAGVRVHTDVPELPGGRQALSNESGLWARKVLESWGPDQEAALVTVQIGMLENGGYNLSFTEYVNGAAYTSEFLTDDLGLVLGKKGCHCPAVGPLICEKRHCDQVEKPVCSEIRKTRYCTWYDDVAFAYNN